MQNAASRGTARTARQTAPRAAPRAQLTRDQELEEMKAYVRQIKNSSKDDAIALLQRAGILDQNGDMAAPYRT